MEGRRHWRTTSTGFAFGTCEAFGSQLSCTENTTITVVSVQVGYLVGGLVVVETLFSYPGIGQLILNAATGHDLPTLEAAVLMIALIYTIANFIADVLYAVLNPRIRLAT